jgi:hypothetical protein
MCTLLQEYSPSVGPNLGQLFVTLYTLLVSFSHFFPLLLLLYASPFDTFPASFLPGKKITALDRDE